MVTDSSWFSRKQTKQVHDYVRRKTSRRLELYMLKCLFSAILLYRVCRCCRRIYVKLFHTIFHALAIPCIVVGFIAVLDSHNLNAAGAIPNFYSLHSWMGLVTMGLFAIQVLKVACTGNH